MGTIWTGFKLVRLASLGFQCNALTQWSYTILVNLLNNFWVDLLNNLIASLAIYAHKPASGILWWRFLKDGIISKNTYFVRDNVHPLM